MCITIGKGSEFSSSRLVSLHSSQCQKTVPLLTMIIQISLRFPASPGRAPDFSWELWFLFKFYNLICYQLWSEWGLLFEEKLEFLSSEISTMSPEYHHASDPTPKFWCLPLEKSFPQQRSPAMKSLRKDGKVPFMLMWLEGVEDWDSFC